jgi:hypothetical protein
MLMEILLLMLMVLLLLLLLLMKTISHCSVMGWCAIYLM